ncbi:MAG TPA: site-specific DNA-methyltransferase [Caldithrix abyssi]|uniref:site-specific DNA-methyltransferase (adenine-specific) n=1 Tax=Caldithrix abyssi TaxID=187145 RepID=A0A7V1LMS7_CALAY|nr:site-specific DNA-methyltransferase [Caldithrix abyssi]
MNDLYRHIQSLLAADPAFGAGGRLLRNSVLEAARRLDARLLQLLLADSRARQYFFRPVQDITVFDVNRFTRFIASSRFLPGSLTAFKNKIGLTVNEELIAENNSVVLAFPYKDAVLPGGQTRENDRHNELFFHETLDAERIDRLFEPKALIRWTRLFRENDEKPQRLSYNDNFLIKGNNLITLHSLKAVYAGKIKLIYIDPPYNTGKDSFGYNDGFSHSTWLTFMKNRLEVARTLLRGDGVIFISIDINEQAYLKVLCDEIFGRANFVGEIIWETATDNNATQISVEHEYVLCYARNKTALPKWQRPSEKAQIIINRYRALKKTFGADTDKIEKELRKWINNVKKSNRHDLSGVSHYCYVDDKGVFYPGNSANTRPGGYDFDIIHPTTKKVCRKPANGYRWPETTFWRAAEKGDVLWGVDETTVPRIKKRIETATELLKGYYYEDNRKSTRALTGLMGKKVFENPKSVNLLKKIISFASDENDIILDFFAGSGSTAQAVLELNAESGGRRSFILCEQMDYIEDVTLARIRRVLGRESLVYMELAPGARKLVDKIAAATTLPRLRKLADEVLADPFLYYGAAHKEEEILSLLRGESDPENLRQMLLALLDQNMLYIPRDEMADGDWALTDEDKKLTDQFYRLQAHGTE